ncbi:MAG: Bax inhibitor-1/YccA family protein [Ilumatobacteraceae bacterium]
MANPLLNDESMRKAAASGWAAPDPSTRATPIDDGPISPWRPGVMTVQGTATATGVLMVLLLASATVGWMSVDTATSGFPALALLGIVVGFACVLALMFRPMWARILAPIYALAEGFAIGVISKFYESTQDGIVLQAVGATLATVLVMLVLYRTQIIKVTDRFRRIVIGATAGVMLLYLVSLVVRLFAGPGSISFLSSPSLLGIGFSVFVCVLAAMNLALDFDFIERGSASRLPKGMEWYAAFGLLVTIVWLYLEILRLLSKLNRR